MNSLPFGVIRAVLFVAATVFAQTKATRPFSLEPPPPMLTTALGAHHIGEAVEEWLAAAGVDLTAGCVNPTESGRTALLSHTNGKTVASAEARAVTTCAIFTAALAGQHTMLDDEKGWHWQFDGRRLFLASIEYADASAIEHFGFLVEKYGTPTDRGTRTFQNGFGAKFECLQAKWKMTDGAVIKLDAFSATARTAW